MANGALPTFKASDPLPSFAFDFGDKAKTPTTGRKGPGKVATQQLPILDAAGKVTGYQAVKVKTKRGPRKAKAAAAPGAGAAAKPGKRAGKRTIRSAVKKGAKSLLARFRGVKRGSKAYNAMKAELRSARVAKGYKGKAPLRRRSLRRHAAPAAAPVAAAAPTTTTRPSKRRRSSKRHGGAPRATAGHPTQAMTTSGGAAPAKKSGKSKSAQALVREAHRASWMGKVESGFDKHRTIVRFATISAAAVGAVKLNARYPEGFTPLKLEASTVGALGTGLLAGLARKVGWRRTSSALVDVTLGAVTGTLASGVGAGKTPMIASK